MQVKFFELSPWADYSVMYTDYDTHTVIYGCDTYLANAIKLEWIWSLTRVPNAIGSAAHTLLSDTVLKVIKDKLPNYDIDDKDNGLRPTEQTVAKGCIYNGKEAP